MTNSASPVDGRSFFRKLVRATIDSDKLLWRQLKHEFSMGTLPDGYGSAIGIVIQSNALACFRALPLNEQTALVAFLKSQSTMPQNCAQAVVAEIMKRAHTVGCRQY